MLREGAQLMGTRKEYKGNPYYEWFSKGTAAQSSAPIQTASEMAEDVFGAPITPAKPKEEVNKWGRGSCWNNAVAIWLYENKDEQPTKDFDSMMKEIAELAEKMVPHQDEFVNNPSND